MKFPATRLNDKNAAASRGYVLVSTLLVLALTVLLVVAMLSMQRRSGSRTAIDRDIVEARANAMFALDTAISELQRYAGPDQAVTANAEILDDGEAEAIPNPMWTGVWSATPEARANQSLGAFLVSGNERFHIDDTTTEYPEAYLDPEDVLDRSDENVIEMVSEVERADEAETASKIEPVLVVRQPLMEPRADGTSRKKGNFAYWVGDEGVKAKVNVLDPFNGTSDDDEKRYRYATAQRSGVEAVLPEFDPENEKNDVAGTMGEFALVQDPPLKEVRSYLHDLTTYSKGLLTDTRQGGLRRDLTTAFESDRIFEREFAAKKTGVTAGTSLRTNDLYTLDTSKLEDFYLVPEILDTAVKSDSNLGRWVGGPNWGSLREYYLLYQRSSSEFPFLPHPRCGVKMRHYSFNPYKHGARNDKRDYYQRNSPVSPVLSRAQMNVRLRTKKIEPATPDEEPVYQIEWEIQPVIGIWNPYNITFSDRTYRFDWEISVFLELKIEGETKRYDLYRLWKDKNSPWFSPNARNCDLQPGENRLFTIDSRQDLRRTVNLTANWTEDGAFWVTLPVDPKNPSSAPLQVKESQLVHVERVGLVASVENQNWSDGLQELQKHNTFFAMKYNDAAGGASANVESSSVRMNNLWKADDRFGPLNVPDPNDDWGGSPFPPFRPAQHTTEPVRLASWAYYLRTSNETDLGHRNFIDSNVRAIVANSRWDGSVEDRGWRALSWLNDGRNRALLPPGNEEPEADGIGRYRGFGGNSIGAAGQTHHIVFDVPREPLLSLGQLQHANIGRYNNEPSFVVGNSYQNIRIPLDQTVVRDFAIHDEKGLYDSRGVDVFDLSYLVNETLWDSYFFSSITPDKLDVRISDLEAGNPLPNSRYISHTPSERLKVEFEASESDDEAYDSLGARFVIDGAFNINSTSVPAWKATLSSLRNLEIPVYDPYTDSLATWEQKGIVFSRLSRPYAKAFNSEEGSTADNFWRGYRELTDQQINDLAEEIVRQIRLRGPFRSLGDFVNRSLVDHDPSTAPVDDTRLSGTLQTALDRVQGVNTGFTGQDIESPVMDVPDSENEFSDVPEAADQGTGYAGYVLQGDVLQALGPVLTARSDTFRIRAYGDKIITTSGTQEILKARAWCEAIVQRIPEPVEPIDAAYSDSRNLVQGPEDIEATYHAVDRPYFGRRFRVVSFRWLEKDEL